MKTLLRIFFYHFYHSLAFTYDLVAAIVSLGRWNDWVRAALPHVRGPRVLEIGFGPGHLQVALDREGFTTLGIDESPQMIRKSRGRVRREIGRPAALVRGLAQNLPFASDSLDCVVATFPSEYLADKRTLAEIFRTLRPGARLVVVPMAWTTGRSLPEAATSWLFKVTGQGQGLTEDVEGRILSIFGEAGFRTEIVYEELRQSVALVIVAEKAGEQVNSTFPPIKIFEPKSPRY
jgi:ubiquinone/menaquinone biosynthesis C-methylase UbiE